jgi:hypothetical protein
MVINGLQMRLSLEQKQIPKTQIRYEKIISSFNNAPATKLDSFFIARYPD